MTATICMIPDLAQALDPSTHRGLGQPDRLGNGAVGLTAVALERLDDGPIRPVEQGSGRRRLLVSARLHRPVGVGHLTPLFGRSHVRRTATPDVQNCVISATSVKQNPSSSGT